MNVRHMTSNPVETDDELLLRMQSGDEEAFLALYRRRQAGLFRFALHMSGSMPVAEDVTQEVFLALLESGHRFDPARATLLAFLYGIARHLILRRITRKRPDDLEAAAEELAADDDLLDDLTRRETIEQVRSAVLSLPLVYREAVVLFDLEGASYEEAAAALDCPVGTVRSRLSRGRAMLAQKLEVKAVRSVS